MPSSFPNHSETRHRRRARARQYDDDDDDDDDDAADDADADAVDDDDDDDDDDGATASCPTCAATTRARSTSSMTACTRRACVMRWPISTSAARHARFARDATPVSSVARSTSAATTRRRRRRRARARARARRIGDARGLAGGSRVNCSAVQCSAVQVQCTALQCDGRGVPTSAPAGLRVGCGAAREWDMQHTCVCVCHAATRRDATTH